MSSRDYLTAAGVLAALLLVWLWLGDVAAMIMALMLLAYGFVLALRIAAVEIRQFEADQRPDLE